MSVDDNLSISFASSIGINNIKDEHLNKNNLYTDLDQLEKSVDAEFEHYMNQARSFPFQEQEQERNREHPDLKDASVHSDFEILGAEILNQVNDELDLDNDSWHRYLENNNADDLYNVKPLRNNTNDFPREEDSGHTSPGEYFGARSLPLNSLNFQQNDEYPLDSQQEERSLPLDSSDYRQERSFPLDSPKYQHEEASLPPNSSEYQQEPLNLSDFDRDQLQELNLSFTSSIKETPVKTRMQRLIEARFKSLPKPLGLFPKYEIPEIELHHLYTQKKQRNRSTGSSSISSTRQQYASGDQRPKTTSDSLSSFHSSRPTNSDEECTIEPASLHFLCEMSPKTIYAKVINLKITNPSPNTVRNFSIFSQGNLLEFEVNEGMILEHEVVQVLVKVRSNALLSYRRQQEPLDEYPSLHDKVLILIDHQQVNQLEVSIDFMSLEDDDDEEEEEEEEEEEKECGRPKCRYCALEKGYPLHSL
ncbi:hypothetical protein INT47_005578 [Mucor saturninus]|uniref:Uncharacterized protein n=1 Tax=Mucor saturninus TaxID=64648 RepID=A0A8H7V3Y9_9FUNG|nr:hypothetical protein INT47_005578 [Mucor saturninus]